MKKSRYKELMAERYRKMISSKEEKEFKEEKPKKKPRKKKVN